MLKILIISVFESYIFKITATSPRGERVNSILTNIHVDRHVMLTGYVDNYEPWYMKMCLNEIKAFMWSFYILVCCSYQLIAIGA